MTIETNAFEEIGRNKLYVSWSNFTVTVGEANNWAYHSRPTHITEKVEVNGVIQEKLRRLTADEPLPVTVHEQPLDALSEAYGKWKASLTRKPKVTLGDKDV